MSEKIAFDVKVRKVESVERQKEDEEKSISKALLRDEDGVVQCILTGPAGKFNNLIPGSIVKITIHDPQKKL